MKRMLAAIAALALGLVLSAPASAESAAGANRFDNAQGETWANASVVVCLSNDWNTLTDTQILRARTSINAAFDTWPNADDDPNHVGFTLLSGFCGGGWHADNTLGGYATRNAACNAVPDDHPAISIHYEAWGGDPSSAGTMICDHNDNGKISWFVMSFNSERNWHWDSSVDSGFNGRDFAGVMMHEMGHVMGFDCCGPADQGHWNESGTLCPNTAADWHTMCDGSWGFIDRSAGRSLEPDDRQELRDHY